MTSHEPSSPETPHRPESLSSATPSQDVPWHTSDAAGATPARGRLAADEIVLAVLLALALGGVAVTDFSTKHGLWYWVAMAPVFAAASIFGGWSRARDDGASPAVVIRTQLLHWIALPLVIWVVYLLQTTGRLNNEDAGLVTLLAFSLCTFLAGVHFDWRFCLVGLLLGATVVCAALVEEFFWVIALPLLLVGGAYLFFKLRR